MLSSDYIFIFPSLLTPNRCYDTSEEQLEEYAVVKIDLQDLYEGEMDKRYLYY
jgi:hypothetical protein